MLEELVVKDYALIDRLSVSFDGGLNILTGETGAGKSIIVGALGFILGAKADVDVVRTGCEETSVSAVLRLDEGNRDALNWLEAKGIGPEDGRIILRRNLKRGGRGTCYVQEAPVPRGDLQEFTALLFDIHGQHEHQALLRRESHRRYLDRFAGIEEEVAEFNRLFLELSDKRKDLAASLDAERGRAARQELLSYAVEEIAKAAPKSGESRSLELEAKRLGDFEKLAAQVNGAAAAFAEGEETALSSLRKTKSALESAAAVDPVLEALARRIADLYYEAEDASDQLRSYRDDLRYDPERLEEVEERLAVLYRLKKKYGEDEDAVLAYRDAAEAELDALSRVEEDRARLEAEIAALEKDVGRRSQALSAKRSSAAVRLSSRITEILATLGMPKAKLAVFVASKGQGPTGLLCGPWGADDVEFLISANLGEPLKELAKIASGGELSRVMLAVKTVLAGADTVETLVFDEIDTGIGGEVALAVGEHLAGIGSFKQIFCITHLASIAVRADNHLKVEKRIEGDRTVTFVRSVPPDERREEIARMLAGDSAGSAALAHADELLKKYGKRG